MVQDGYETPTTALADVVLPATTFAEMEGTSLVADLPDALPTFSGDANKLSRTLVNLIARFYDPRAFRTVIPVLDAAARREIFGPIHGVYVEGRAPDSVLFFCGRENFPVSLKPEGQAYAWGAAMTVADPAPGRPPIGRGA